MIWVLLVIRLMTTRILLESAAEERATKIWALLVEDLLPLGRPTYLSATAQVLGVEVVTNLAKNCPDPASSHTCVLLLVVCLLSFGGGRREGVYRVPCRVGRAESSMTARDSRTGHPGPKVLREYRGKHGWDTHNEI